MTVGIFKFGTLLIKTYQKLLLPPGLPEIRNYLPVPFSGNIFLISVMLDFVSILSENKGFTIFQNVLLSLMSRVLVLLNKFFFSF